MRWGTCTPPAMRLFGNTGIGVTCHHGRASGGAGGGLDGGVGWPQQLPPQRRQAGRIRLCVQMRQQLQAQHI